MHPLGCHHTERPGCSIRLPPAVGRLRKLHPLRFRFARFGSAPIHDTASRGVQFYFAVDLLHLGSFCYCCIFSPSERSTGRELHGTMERQVRLCPPTGHSSREGISLSLSFFFFFFFFFRGMKAARATLRAEAHPPRAMFECPLSF